MVMNFLKNLDENSSDEDETSPTGSGDGHYANGSGEPPPGPGPGGAGGSPGSSPRKRPATASVAYDDDEEEEAALEMPRKRSRSFDIEGNQAAAAAAQEEDGDDDDDDDDDDESTGSAESPSDDPPGYEPVTDAGQVDDGSPDWQGATAVVALLIRGDNPTLYVANIGDSRCVLCRQGESVSMSEDHKPDGLQERARIEAAGFHVTEEGRINGELNLSRAFGDYRFKRVPGKKPDEQPVSCVPEIFSVPLTNHDEYIVLGCDGIFERETNEQVIKFFTDRDSQSATCDDAGAKKLAQTCGEFMDGNCANTVAEHNFLGCDNMSMVAARLPKGLPDGNAVRVMRPRRWQRKCP